MCKVPNGQIPLVNLDLVKGNVDDQRLFHTHIHQEKDNIHTIVAKLSLLYGWWVDEEEHELFVI